MTKGKLLTLGAVCLGTIFCQSGGQSQVPTASPPAVQTASATPTAAPASGVRGSIKFLGTPPPAATLRREADPFCGKTKMSDPTVLVNPNGTLKNVLVRVKGPVGGTPGVAGTAKMVDQNNCMYEPRVVGLGPSDKLLVKNSDPVLHNIHCFQDTKTCFNQAQPKGGKEIEKTLAPGIYRLKCDVHPWMTGYVVANENPYVAVTGDTGEFILNVPAGAYTVEAWHEKYGTQTASVTVPASGAATTDFTFQAK